MRVAWPRGGIHDDNADRKVFESRHDRFRGGVTKRVVQAVPGATGKQLGSSKQNSNGPWLPLRDFCDKGAFTAGMTR